MKKVLFFLVFAVIANGIFPQVSINANGTAPAASAGLDVDYTDKGFLPPRMTTAQRTAISNPADGLMVYDTDASCLFFYQASASTWVNTCSGGGPAHYIGELYGGGVVFWVDGSGEHGQIVSLVDLSTSQAWSNVTSTLIGTTNKWDGASNTAAIIGQSGHTDSAAKLCDNYTNADYGTGTFSDWYLPSLGELNVLWNNMVPVAQTLANDGNPATVWLTDSYYWSSSEYNGTNAWGFGFYDGSTYGDTKDGTHYVRAVRAF
ncbi:MAG: DUF1566 domain-containing protein [Crocinitomicaceae bacterium]|nr:DUF1566 domain-containing protein [Crocinitomicaceae bacterium]